LAPGEGTLTIPGLGGDAQRGQTVPGELRFARHQIITELDRRLDSQAWFGAGPMVPARGLIVEGRRGSVEAVGSEESQAGPWLGVCFAEPSVVLIVCGFRIIECWANGSTPRFLLIRLLEAVSAAKAESEI